MLSRSVTVFRAAQTPALYLISSLTSSYWVAQVVPLRAGPKTFHRACRRRTSSSLLASCPEIKAYRRCFGPTSRSTGNVRHCCSWVEGRQTHPPTFPTAPWCALGGHTITLWPRFAAASLLSFHRFALTPARRLYWRRWPVDAQ